MRGAGAGDAVGPGAEGLRMAAGRGSGAANGAGGARGRSGSAERAGGGANGKKKEDSEESSLLVDGCCGYAADLATKSLYVTDPNVPSVVVFSAPASSTYLMTSFASTA